MLFNSFEFLFLFLPVSLLIALRLRGQRLLFWIGLSSLAFYALAGQPWFLVPMVFTTSVDFFLAQALGRCEAIKIRRLLLAISLSLNFGLLFLLKYATWVHANFPGLAGINWPWLQGLGLPAGISFYTFQTASYMIDVYRRDALAERNFLKFFGFVSFFPHLVAGPLTRHNQLIPGLSSISENGILPRWENGISLFSFGLAKKVLLGDRLAEALRGPYSSLDSMGMAGAWITLIGFSMQIYFDFSGYCDMALGIARLFGIELPQNFKSPYQALNPSDFWRRWHVTLSQWFRDYLYIPLGGGKHGKTRQVVSLLITMILGGLWHGAAGTFFMWGLFHGILLIFYHLTKVWWDKIPAFLSKALTFMFVCLGWVWFKSSSFSEALHWYHGLFGANGFWKSTDADTFAGNAYALAYLLPLGLLLTMTQPEFAEFQFSTETKSRQMAMLGFLAALGVLFLDHSSTFIYFQF